MICPKCGTDNGNLGDSCWKCGTDLTVGAPVVPNPVHPEQYSQSYSQLMRPGALDLDKYFVNQKPWARNDANQYPWAHNDQFYIYDEAGNELFFVENDASMPSRGRSWFYRLAAFSNIKFYSDESKLTPIMNLDRDRSTDTWMYANMRMVLTLPTGEVIAIFQRQGLLTNVLQTWQILYPDGKVMATVKEHSYLIALLRRFIVAATDITFITDFVITIGKRQVGTFKRRMTLTDKYVLDLTTDPQKTFDRRVAVALTTILGLAKWQ